MILLAKTVLSEQLFDWKTNNYWISSSTACYETNSTEVYNTEDKLLKQQVFSSYWRYFIEGAQGRNLVSCALLELPIRT